jgi:hypothetical protein
LIKTSEAQTLVSQKVNGTLMSPGLASFSLLSASQAIEVGGSVGCGGTADGAIAEAGTTGCDTTGMPGRV